MPSSASDVTGRSAMPHGTMCSRKYAMSVATLRANPCIVRPRLRRTPMAQIFRGFGPVGVDPHTGVLGQPPGRQAERGERVDQELLDVAHVLGRAEPVASSTDRVADELARHDPRTRVPLDPHTLFDLLLDPHRRPSDQLARVTVKQEHGAGIHFEQGAHAGQEHREQRLQVQRGECRVRHQLKTTQPFRLTGQLRSTTSEAL